MKRIIIIIGLIYPCAANGTYSLYALYDEDGGSMTDTEIEEHFNLARCLCDEAAGSDESLSTTLALDYDGDYDGTDHYFYMGSDCSNTAVDLDNCADLGTENVNALSSSLLYIPIPVNYLVDPDDGVCSEISSGSNTLSIFSSRESRTTEYTYSMAFDTKPPTAPYDISVSSGENALVVSWDTDDVEIQGIERFNILCMRDDVPAEGASENQADWVDTELVCGKTLSVSEEKRTWNLKQRDCPAGAVTTGGRPVACYVCGSVASGVGKVRIEGLENTVEYTVSVVAVDDFNNPSEQSEAVTGIPMPTMDFAEAYKAAGGDASGEYCFIGSTVFGGKTHFALTPLRRFRDSILLPFSPTRKLVRWYYANGGTWAKAMEGSGVKGQALLALLKLLFSLMALLLALPHWFFVCAAAIFFMNSFYSMRVRLRG